MSRENVDLIRDAYEAVNRRDFEWVSSVVAPGFEYESVRTGHLHVGVGGIRELMRELDEAFVSYEQTPERIIEATDDTVIALIRLTGTGRASSVPVEQLHAHVWQLRDGKFVRGAGYLTHAEALEAVGLSE
jgi:ketosteroid isomerase-like protein